MSRRPTGVKQLFGVGRGDKRNLRQWPPGTGYPASLPIKSSFGLWYGFRLFGTPTTLEKLAQFTLGKNLPTVGTLGVFANTSGNLEVKLNGTTILTSNFPVIDPGSPNEQTTGYDTYLYVSGTGQYGINKGSPLLFYLQTYVNSAGETTASSLNGSEIPDNASLKVDSPAGPLAYGQQASYANATEYNVYASATYGGPYYLQNETPVALGTATYLNPATLIDSGAQLPATNTAQQLLPATPTSAGYSVTTVAGGSLPARTYYYCLAYQQTNGDTTAASSIKSIAIPADQLFSVNFSEEHAGINASYVVVYAGTTDNIADLSAQTSNLPVTAASWTEPTTGLVSNTDHPPNATTITTYVPESPTVGNYSIISDGYLAVAIYTDRKDGNGMVPNGFINYPIQVAGTDGSLQAFTVNDTFPASQWAIYFQPPDNLSRFTTPNYPMNQPPGEAYTAPARCSPAAMPQTILRLPPGTPQGAPLGTPTACSLVDQTADYPMVNVTTSWVTAAGPYAFTGSLTLPYMFDKNNGTWIPVNSPQDQLDTATVFAAAFACSGETWSMSAAGASWGYANGGQSNVIITGPLSPAVASDTIPNIDGVLGQGASEAVYLCDIYVPYDAPNPTYSNVPIIFRATTTNC
jgi:hypothetical protein